MAWYNRNRRQLAKRRKKQNWAANMRKNPTPAEAAMWELLKNKATGHTCRRQFVKCGYILDFYLCDVMIAIEVDGSSHDGREDYDDHRDEVMEEHGILTLRFSNDTVFSDPDGVMKDIMHAVEFMER